MNKIYNTIFNNIAGATSNGNKTQFVEDATLIGRFKNRYMALLSEENPYELGIVEFAYRIAYDTLYIAIEDAADNRTILFGEDSLEFARYIVDILGLTNEVPGVTNVHQTSWTLNIPEDPDFTGTITLESNSPTFEYVSFTDVKPNPDETSNSLVLIDTDSVGDIGTLIITATFDDDGNVESLNFENTAT
jgi:hypothetical protein